MERDANGNPYTERSARKQSLKARMESRYASTRVEYAVNRLLKKLRPEEEPEMQFPPAGRSPGEPEGQRYTDPERILLLRFFLDNPDVAKACGLQEPQLREKYLLLECARDCFRENWSLLEHRNGQKQWSEELQRDMNRENGLLGILNQLLREARRRDTVSWKIHRDRARRKLEELEMPRTRAVCPQEAIPRTVQELVQALHDQLRRIREPQSPASDYQMLYQHIRHIPLPEELGEGNFWLRRTESLLARGMDELDQDLREALQEDYPHLFSPESP